MIGLKRGTVKLLPYQKQWAKAFEKEKANLERRIGKFIVEIQHVGSTSVPGLRSKPIIDMSAGLRRLKDWKKLVEPLDTAGYHFYKTFGDQVLFAKGPDTKRTHYLHVMRYNGSKWRSDVLFRDYLRSHPAKVKAYARLKKALAKKYSNDRERYTAGKKDFIDRVKALARKHGV